MQGNPVRVRKRAVAGLVGLALALGGLALPSPAGAVASVAVTRFGGADRFDTAARISAATFTSSTTAIVATGRDFADALAASALSGRLRAPVLLTQPDTLPATTSAELTRLGATNIILLGGSAAVNANVENALRTGGRTVTRTQGDTRYTTATGIARQIGATNIGTVNGLRTVFLATGTQFADALAAGPPAFARVLPVLLTTADTLTPETAAALTELAIQQVIIVGGVNAVSANVQNQADALASVTTVLRYGGANRQETATQLGQFVLNQNADFPTFDGVDIALARGDDFADALAGAPHAGNNGAPIILAQGPTTLGTATGSFLSANFATVTNLFIYGGIAAISDAVATAAQTAAQTPLTAPTGVTVAPSDNATLAQSSARTYTATLRNADGTPYTGQVLIRVLDFVSGSTPTAVVPTAGTDGRGAVFIETVNGTTAGIATPTATTATVFGGVAGQLSFVLRDNLTTGAAADGVPQVILDQNGNGQFDAGEPSALGGAVIYTAAAPAEAAAGSFVVTVGSVSATGNSFTGSSGGATPTAATFEFDSTDVFTVNNIGVVDLNTFRARLNAGDTVSIVYDPDVADQSTFNITNDLANAPLTVTTPAAPTTVDQNTFTIAGNGQPGFTVTAYRDLANDNDYDSAIDPAVGGPVTVNPDGSYAVSVTLSQGTSTTPANNDFIVVQRPANSTSDPSDTTTAGPNVEAVPRITESPIGAFTFTATGAPGASNPNGQLAATDSIRLDFTGGTFSATPSAGATVSVRDEDGTTATLTNGGNATFSLVDNNTILVTITGLTGATGGSVSTLLLAPVAITAISGFTGTTNAGVTGVAPTVSSNGVLIGGSY